MILRKNRFLITLVVTTMLLMICGCKGTMNDILIDSKEGNIVVSDTWDKKLEDNKLLYSNDDDISVITMYLTVSIGNASENTNHTWEEINSYSVYDYDEMGVERYAVNGLLQVGDKNGPLEGELGYEQYVPNATVTIRGQTSTRFARKNYKIELKDGKGTFNDQRVINLNKHQMDYTRFTNKLCYDLIEEIPGMIAMQTQFVHLYVKDETAAGGDANFVDYGLYTQVEQPNKSFLQRHGLDKNGHLYKINAFEFYRYEDIIMLKSDADYDDKSFEERIEIKGSDDHSKLIAMLEDVNNYSMPIEDVLDKWFEKDNLFSWLTFQILTGNIDTQSRNTLIYSPQNVNTWYFISWDCDGAFATSKDEIEGSTDEGSWEKGISNYWGNVLFQRILKDDELRKELDAKLLDFMTILTAENIQKKAEAYAEVVKPYAYGYPDNLNMPITEAKYDALINILPYEIEKNYAKYIENLEEPMPFFIGTPQVTESGFTIMWDSAYDFDAETITYKFELARDLAFTDIVAQGDNILLPGYTYEGTLESGQYFIRVQAENESGKTQYAFDYYVSDGSIKNFGIKCFYVLQDGSIMEDVYEE